MKAGLKRFNFAVARTVTRWLTRPKAVGAEDVTGENLVYVLHHRSLTDLIILDLVAPRHGLPRPTLPLPAEGLDEARRFFFLNRGAGAWRRHTMREYSARWLRLEDWLLEGPERVATLVPVAVFWGRAASKERSFARALFSEHWAATSRFRRFLSLFLNRTDILVQFGAPLPWRSVIDPNMDKSRMTRRTARLLRVKFRNQRTAALGPDLSHRRTLVEDILASRAVRDAIAAEPEAERDEALKLARRYANRIASDMSYPAIRLLNRVLTWLWHRLYDGVEVSGFEPVAAVADTHTVVYAPSHRSHIDYLLLSYVLFHRGLMIPHIAAGENMNMALAGPLLRRGGAFFMRRHFLDDRLYTAVFSEYFYTVLRRGHSVEYFIEGGRSRTGRLLRPRTGLIKMTLSCVRRGVPRPLALVPVYIGYEKLIEAGTYLNELRGAAKAPESARGVLRSLRLVRQSFGKVALNFGEPIELDAFTEAHGEGGAARLLGLETLVRINAAASVNPVNLVALCTLSMPRQAIDEPLLHEQIDCLRELLQAGGAAQGVTSAPAAEVVAAVERLGLLHRERQAFGDVLSHSVAAAVQMTWYRNNVLHVFAAPALVASLLINRRRRATREDLARFFEAIFPYVRGEFFLPEANAETATGWLSALVALGLVRRDAEGLYAAPPPEAPERLRLKLLANTLRETIERFHIVASALTLGSPLTQPALEARCGAVARRMSRIYGIDAPEFFDAELFHRFVDALLERGAVRRGADGLLHAEPVVRLVTRAARQVLDDEFRQAVALLVAGMAEEPMGDAPARAGASAGGDR